MDVALRAASTLKKHDLPFCGCCPAGGLDFEKSHLLYLFNILQVAKLLYLVGFEHQECPRTLSVDKNMQNALVNVSNGLLDPEL